MPALEKHLRPVTPGAPGCIHCLRAAGPLPVPEIKSIMNPSNLTAPVPAETSVPVPPVAVHPCPDCGDAMVQKSPARLLIVGFALLVSSCIAIRLPALLVPPLIAVLTGLYLLVWATFGHGRWCRNCKSFKIDGG